jgi:hypothetical protein
MMYGFGLGWAWGGLSIALTLVSFSLLVHSIFMISGRRTIYLYRRIIIVVPLSLWILYYCFNNYINDRGLEGLVWWFILIFFIAVLNPRVIKKSNRTVVLLSLLSLFFDAIIRFMSVDLDSILNNYYVVKQNAIFGVDSNVSGVVCVVTGCLLVLAKPKFSKLSYFLHMVALGLLTILTLSKAAVISLFILLIYVFSYRLFLLVVILVLLASPLIITGFESGLTKFQILYEFKEYLIEASGRELLLGFGVNNFIFSGIDLNPHVLLVQLVVYFGFIGSLLYFTFWVCLFVYCRRRLMVFLVPYTFLSLSFTPIMLPIMCYLILTMIASEE